MVMSGTLFPLKKKKKKLGSGILAYQRVDRGSLGEALNLIKG